MSEDLILEDFSIGNSQYFSVTAQPTPLIRLNLFNSLHLFCWLMLYLEWTLLKANHLHVAQCLTSCHCSMTAYQPPASISLVVPFCFRGFYLPVCLSWQSCCWQDFEIAGRSNEWYSWDQNWQASLAEVWNPEWKVAACPEPRNSTAVFTKRKDLGMLLPGVLAMLTWDWVVWAEIITKHHKS